MRGVVIAALSWYKTGTRGPVSPRDRTKLSPAPHVRERIGMDSRKLAAMIVGVIALLLAAGSLMIPWWGGSAVAAGTPTSGAGSYSLDLGGIRSVSVIVGTPLVKDGPWSSSQYSNLRAVHEMTSLLVYVALGC